MERPDIEELRNEVRQFMRSQQPASPGTPLPSTVDRQTLTPEAETAISDAWINSILARAPETWLPAERDAVRTATQRALTEVGF